MTEDSYEGKPVDPDELMQSSFGIYRGAGDAAVSIVLEFEKELAPFVSERTWHKSQRVIAKSGGRARMELDVALTPDLVQWVLGFGAMVTVMEPASLQEKVIEAAAAVVKKYRLAKAA